VTKKQVRDKIREMVKDDKKRITEKVEKALASGAFNINDYLNDYNLPKLILYAIYSDILFQRKPLSSKALREAENLGCFI